MSVKFSSSSSSNDSLLDANLSSINSYTNLNCLITKASALTFTAFNLIRIFLLLPLCILILCLGLQRWRQQRSSTAATMSHSDVFTYHVATMELFVVSGSILCVCGVYGDHNLMFSGFCLWSVAWYGETFFHLLTCVERYLAVVHPITYMSLRRERCIRIRNISIGCIWLLSLGLSFLMSLGNIFQLIVDFSLLIFSLIVISFCSLSVLCILIRPGPGDSERVDQSKQRAFYTIVTILGVLALRCVCNLVWVSFSVNNASGDCVVLLYEVLFNLPSSLVLPLLFLHRAGKLGCCKTK